MIDAELQPGERVTWSGQPIPGRFARRSIAIVIFGIPFTAFAIFWIAGASEFKQPDFSGGAGLFPLFGVPFVLIGLGMLSSPFWMRLKAARTAYAITDRRALIIEGRLFRSIGIRSFESDRLRDIRRVQNSDGSGDLIFERTWTTDADGARQSTDHGFQAISDVKAVETLIRQLAETSKQRSL